MNACSFYLILILKTSLEIFDNKIKNHIFYINSKLPGMSHCIIYLYIQLVYMPALPCLGPLAPRGAVGARHDGLPRQFSPPLPVVCHGPSLSEGFAGPLCDVITPALFQHAPCIYICMKLTLLCAHALLCLFQRWEYGHVPQEGTTEAELMAVLKKPVEWL